MTCKVENNLSEGVWWNTARTEGGEYRYTPGGEYPNDLKMTFFTFACQHCDNPACVGACPTGASQKREDGIVIVDASICIGCDSCIAACPYEGVRTHLENPSWCFDFNMGDCAAPTHLANTVEKCTLCSHRIDRGELPACVEICQSQARYFGDLDDPESEVSKLIAERDYDLLLEDQGTGPNVYYLK
ncbi:4Fe-4S dicluster domain-containing protein [Xiamenia xianingshaonis]|nr:4Fe-4S dicluster domain-containing protein [Xiamenia xianingshaonis]